MWPFYNDDEKQEIYGWIKKGDNTLREEIQKQLGNLVTAQQLSQYDAEFKSQIDVYLKGELSTLQRDITAIKMASVSASELSALKAEVSTLRQELNALKSLSSEISTLKTDVSELLKKLSTLKAPPEVQTLQADVSALKQTIDALKTPPEVQTLQADVSALRQTIDALKAPTTPPEPPTPPPSPEELFFLPEPQGVFITNERTKIPAQIKQALNVSGIEKYLAANPSDASKKFQRLLNNHSRDVKKFVDKLRLSEPDESELSEVITTKYFKLFHRTIFDNLLVAIRRGLKDSEKFYLGLLAEVNRYLSRCGIYSVNMKSGKQAETEDYENITPQIVKTDDKSLSGTISDIERLPYRINYLDEFGEQKFLQYAGVASIYKAV